MYLLLIWRGIFWVQMALASLVAVSGPKKVSISGPTPFNGPRNGYCIVQCLITDLNFIIFMLFSVFTGLFFIMLVRSLNQGYFLILSYFWKIPSSSPAASRQKGGLARLIWTKQERTRDTHTHTGCPLSPVLTAVHIQKELISDLSHFL
jgi:hypothetical protein